MLAAAGRTNTRLRRSSSKSRIEPGQLTPKMQKFLAEAKDSEPFLVVDVDIVEHNYRELRRLLPLAKVYYAIKANPAPEILRRLRSLGSCFDTASANEIQQCLNQGVSPDRISFGNTIKKKRDKTNEISIKDRKDEFEAELAAQRWTITEEVFEDSSDEA